GNGLCGLEICLFGSLVDRDRVCFVGGRPRVRAVWSPRSTRPRGLERGGPTSAACHDQPGRRLVVFRRTSRDSVDEAAEALSTGTGAVYVLPRALWCDRQQWDQIGCIIERLLATQS